MKKKLLAMMLAVTVVMSDSAITFAAEEAVTLQEAAEAVENSETTENVETIDAEEISEPENTADVEDETEPEETADVEAATEPEEMTEPEAVMENAIDQTEAESQTEDEGQAEAEPQTEDEGQVEDATGAEIYENTFSYEKFNNGTEIRITDYTESSDTTVEIPAAIDGVKVTEIGKNAFRGQYIW